MHIYKIKAFSRFQRSQRLSDAALAEAVRRAEPGLVDADLGSGLIKQRIARPGQGKRGGYRTILVYRKGDRAVFLYGFAKNERDNIDPDELNYWRHIGQVWLGLDEAAMVAAESIGEVEEIG